MRVAMVSEHTGEATAGGGAVSPRGEYVGELAHALTSRGHEVTAYVRGDDPEAVHWERRFPQLRIVRLPVGGRSGEGNLGHLKAMGDQLAHCWRADPPEIVHTHYWTAAVAGALGRQEVAVPLVHSFHSLGRVELGHARGQRTDRIRHRIHLERAICGWADRVLAACQDEARELAALGVPRAKVAVVPYGVDVERFRPTGPTEPRTDRPRFLAVADPTSEVAAADVANALGALRSVPGAELVLAGGPSRCELTRHRLFHRLLRLADRLKVTDRFRVLGGVPEERLPRLIRSADAVVCAPSRYLAFETIPLQAMACARPVVGTGVGSLVDIVVEGTTGLLAPPGRPTALAAAQRRLLTEAMLLEGFGIAARQRAEVRYSWQRVAAEVEAVYASLVDTSATAPLRTRRTSSLVEYSGT